ncbi:unnamed protein product, partial [marine sediment metagenome]
IEPINPIKNICVTIDESLHLSSTLKITARNSDGNIKREMVVKEPKRQVKKPIKKVENTFTYTFSDWTGNEDIETLGKIYLQDLKRFIGDGANRSFITG